MAGLGDKIKESLPGTSGQHTSSSSKTESYSESHISTVTPAHPTLLPAEATQSQVGGDYGSQGQAGLFTAPQTQPQAHSFPTSGGGSQHTSIPGDHAPGSQTTPSGPLTPQLSPRLPNESQASLTSGPTSQQAPSSVMYEGSQASGHGITPDISSRLAASNTAPGGPTYEPSGNAQRVVPGFDSHAQERQAPSRFGYETSPGIADTVGASSGASLPGSKGHGTSQGVHLTGTGGGASTGVERVSAADKASIGGGGVNASTTPTATPASGLPSGQVQGQAQPGTQGYVQQAKDTAAPYVAKAQETAAPYVAKAQETVGPYVSQAQETAGPYIAKVQETAGPYVAKAQETVGPYVSQAQEAASPYVAKARDLGSSAVESARPVINQASQAASSAINTAAAELDARGINMETSKQKLADAGQVAKDYGTAGQQKAGEYLSQAVDQAKNMDRENKGIIASIFGTVVLVWLAFGFSLVAMLSLGVAAAIAAILARFSRKRVDGGEVSGTQTTANIQQKNIPGVETHYPRRSHPDNSLNNAAS